ncbi:hypothetical protein F2P45_12925 [Massilia sp. CCM 8733]|uniref:Aromatic ring-opening dioxygenase LigA n=1 Tax=Massilia mucilaginosa TaxID=2609282 RepID=A0ABX0NT19_9BURK|nr:hypothetical protein [Massilia mucilaginosa]NHZ89909.1 hypothetical protein [Massilia mucilaginosa]
MDIALNFINLSNEQDDAQIVIFQKNVATGFDEIAVAWQVIKNCGIGENHPFTFPMEMSVKASDSDGNYSPELLAENGQIYDYARGGSGNGLTSAGAGPSMNEVHVRNALGQGAINANIMKAGKVLAMKTSVAPGQKAVFQFKPTIWIGAVSQIVQGAVMNSAVISDVNTELSLLGVKSADIVMRGGGPGASSTPLTFTLTNVQMA